MDYVKRDTNLFDTMHFVDYPYNIHDDVNGPQPDATNAVAAIGNIGRSLIFGKNGQVNTGTWSKAFSTLALIHFIGDMHQPLHATALFSKKWKFNPPLGDRGGNDFKCDYTSETGMKYTQIHLLYDCVGGLYCDYMPSTITPEYEMQIKTITDSVMETYPVSGYDSEYLFPSTMFNSRKAFNTTVTGWAIESFEAAKGLYDQLEPGQALTPEFIADLRPLLLERIAVAGYRLAHVLERTDLTKVGPEPYQEAKQIYRISIIALAVLLVVAIVFAAFYKHLYTESKTAAYVNFNNVQVQG